MGTRSLRWKPLRGWLHRWNSLSTICSYEGDEPPTLPNLSKRQTTEELVLDAEQEKELRFYEKVKRLLSRIDEKDRQLLLYMAQKLASR